jgi:hypothetical protein
MKETVILFGTNTFTRHLIDWQRDDCEYWAWNEVGSLKDDRPNYWAKRVDLLIQLHASPIWRNHNNLNHGRQQSLESGEKSNSHYDWLQRVHEFPIYMQDHFEDVPSSVKYPIDEIISSLLPNLKREYGKGVQQVENFTSSFAYAMALAIYQGVKKIEIYGIEMTSDTEYVRQRPGGYFWIGLATGKGIEVILHSPLLMNDKRYGYTGEVMIQRQEFEMSARQLDTLVENAKARAFESKGRSQALLAALLQTTSQSDAQRLTQEFLKVLNDSQSATFEYGQMAGRYQENDRYLKECDELIMAAGGEKALQVLVNEPMKVE